MFLSNHIKLKDRHMAHEVDRLLNEIKWAITDKIGEVQNAVGRAEKVAAEQWANLMVKSYASNMQMTESDARTALILLGVAAAYKVQKKTPIFPPPGALKDALEKALRSINVTFR
jgi:hypothetical protein